MAAISFNRTPAGVPRVRRNLPAVLLVLVLTTSIGCTSSPAPPGDDNLAETHSRSAPGSAKEISLECEDAASGSMDPSAITVNGVSFGFLDAVSSVQLSSLPQVVTPNGRPAGFFKVFTKVIGVMREPVAVKLISPPDAYLMYTAITSWTRGDVDMNAAVQTVHLQACGDRPIQGYSPGYTGGILLPLAPGCIQFDVSRGGRESALSPSVSADGAVC